MTFGRGGQCIGTGNNELQVKQAETPTTTHDDNSNQQLLLMLASRCSCCLNNTLSKNHSAERPPRCRSTHLRGGEPCRVCRQTLVNTECCACEGEESKTEIFTRRTMKDICADYFTPSSSAVVGAQFWRKVSPGSGAPRDSRCTRI